MAPTPAILNARSRRTHCKTPTILAKSSTLLILDPILNGTIWLADWLSTLGVNVTWGANENANRMVALHNLSDVYAENPN